MGLRCSCDSIRYLHSANIDAFSIRKSDNAFLLSTVDTETVPDIGTVQDEDIFAYKDDRFSLVLRGASVTGLGSEDIDALSYWDANTFYISTINPAQFGFNVNAGDIVKFDPVTKLFSQYFQGNQAGLGSANITGITVLDNAPSASQIYISESGGVALCLLTKGQPICPGLAAVVRFDGQTGSNTSGLFKEALCFDASQYPGLENVGIDALYVKAELPCEPATALDASPNLPSTPVIASPLADAIVPPNTEVNFAWSASGDTYTFELTGGPDEMSITVDKNTLSLGNITPGDYQLRIRAERDGAVSEWSNMVAFHVVDVVAPTVTSINRLDPNPSSASTVKFVVIFSEPVQHIDLSDFTLFGSSAAVAIPTSVSGSENTYTVTVVRGPDEGTLRLDITDDDSITDTAGNLLGGVGIGNGDFTTGQTYTLLTQGMTVSGNAGVAGATLQYMDGATKTVTANAMGAYEISVPFNWKGTITPFKPGYTFTPTSLSYENITSNMTEQNYLAAGASVNIMPNGGLNIYTGKSKIPRGWKAINFAPTDGKTTSTKYEGAASLKIAGQVAKLKTFSQIIPLAGGGETFQFSFWMRGMKVPAKGLCRAYVIFYNNSTKPINTQSVNCATGTYAFRQFHKAITVPTPYTKIEIRFTYGKASGTIWLDNVSLIK